jgi:hypothetical protein
MNDSRREAEKAIRKVAELKARQTLAPVAKEAEKKANLTLKDLGVEPEYAMGVIGALKGMSDLNQGYLEVPVSKEVDIGIINKPNDKGLKLKFNKKFD